MNAVDFKSTGFKSMEFKSLSFSFGEQALFQQLDVQFPMGEVVLITGGAGSGKSSFLKVMAGLISPQSGSYEINGQSVAEMTFEEFLPWRLKMGYSFELGGLLSNKTVFENLALPLLYHKICEEDEVQARVESIMQEFGLTKVAHQRPSQITGGMRKAAIVARAFVMDPEVLLLDEPAVGLNHQAVERMRLMIKSSRESGLLKHVFVASNDHRFIEDLGTTVIEIGSKRLSVYKIK